QTSDGQLRARGVPGLGGLRILGRWLALAHPRWLVLGKTPKPMTTCLFAGEADGSMRSQTIEPGPAGRAAAPLNPVTHCGSNVSVLPGRGVSFGGRYASHPSAPSTNHGQSRRMDCTTCVERACTRVGAMLSRAAAFSLATLRAAARSAGSQPL